MYSLSPTRRSHIAVLTNSGLRAREARQRDTAKPAKGSAGISRAEPGGALGWFLAATVAVGTGLGSTFFAAASLGDRMQMKAAIEQLSLVTGLIFQERPEVLEITQPAGAAGTSNQQLWTELPLLHVEMNRLVASSEKKRGAYHLICGGHAFCIGRPPPLRYRDPRATPRHARGTLKLVVPRLGSGRP